MGNAQVRIVQDQSVESVREVTGSEAEEILRKYGQDKHFSTRTQELQVPIQNDLTFEEMVYRQETKQREERARIQNIINGPKPITFDSKNGYDTEIRYGSDESGFGFRIEITSDMKLPK